jgi:hypothetical protein
MTTYRYTIYDAFSDGKYDTAWDTHTWVELQAESYAEAREKVFDVMREEAADLSPADGYAAGDALHAIVWDDDGMIVASRTYIITGEDLGI